MEPARVIVGIGDHPGSRPALRWAAAEAVRRGSVLRIVHAALPEVCHPPDDPGAAAPARTHDVVTAAVGEVRQWAPDLRVSGETAPGRPAAGLIAAAGRDDLLVVGSRDRAGPASAVCGPTCQLVALYARSPVAVVRGRSEPETGPIAVGYDGSPAGESVLVRAFEAATARACGVTVIRIFPHRTGGRDALTVRAMLTLDARRVVAPTREKFPDVAVDILVTGGDPAWNLVTASRGARLVVIGSLRVGGVAGRPVDSAGLRLIHHAHCPVLITRP